MAQGGNSIDDTTVVVARDGHASCVDMQLIASGDALSGHRKADMAFAVVIYFDLTTCRTRQQCGEIVGRGAQLGTATTNGDLLRGQGVRTRSPTHAVWQWDEGRLLSRGHHAEGQQAERNKCSNNFHLEFI